jgi:hypothetical protein
LKCDLFVSVLLGTFPIPLRASLFLVSLFFWFYFLYRFLLSALLRIHSFFPCLNQTGVLSTGRRPAMGNNNKIGPRMWILKILSILKWNCTGLEVRLAAGHVA